jgi:hypothetical protein
MAFSARVLGLGTALVAALALGITPAAAQQRVAAANRKGDKEQPAVTLDLALSATKQVLVQQGFEVLSVETLSDRQIVMYRAGNQGRGRGKGPPARLVIRRVENRIVLDDTPDNLKVAIGVKLGITF